MKTCDFKTSMIITLVILFILFGTWAGSSISKINERLDAIESGKLSVKYIHEHPIVDGVVNYIEQKRKD